MNNSELLVTKFDAISITLYLIYHKYEKSYLRCGTVRCLWSDVAGREREMRSK